MTTPVLLFFGTCEETKAGYMYLGTFVEMRKI